MPETQSTSAPLPDRQVSSTSGYVPVLGIHTYAFSGVTWWTISLNVIESGSAGVAGSANVAVGGTSSGAGIVTGSNEPVSYQSTSTHPSIPGTVPQLPYCQNVHPLPPQFAPGTVGDATFQCATHSSE